MTTTKMNLRDRANLVRAPIQGTVEEDLTAAGTGTTPLEVYPGVVQANLAGTWTALVHFQYKPSGGATWYDLDPDGHTSQVGKVLQIAAKGSVRAYIKAGNYTSGTINVMLSQGV